MILQLLGKKEVMNKPKYKNVDNANKSLSTFFSLIESHKKFLNTKPEAPDLSLPDGLNTTIDYITIRKIYNKVYK